MQANEINSDIPCPTPKGLYSIEMRFNYFDFDGQFYKQIIGASTSTIPSPEMCDTIIYPITQHIVTQFRHASKILFNGKYQDDGIVMFKTQGVGHVLKHVFSECYT